MYEVCPECKRLWDELADAVRVHIAAQQKSALLSEPDLLPLIAAQERRATARRDFRVHQAAHESGKAKAQSA
jgi:hypothetical protein